MSRWRPLSVRTGQREEDGPHEGVPDHVMPHLVDWIRDAVTQRSGYTDSSLLRLLVLRLEVVVPFDCQTHHHLDALLTEAVNDPQLMLDLVDMLLWARVGNSGNLDTALTTGGSVWSVAERGLERRVSDAEQEAKKAAVAPADAAADELSAAWRLAFGVRPDPSDAWDHAIKALEALLIPIVVPKQANPTLGHVVGVMKADPAKWTVDLETNGDLTDGETLLGLLQLVWANPDRHGNVNSRVPTQAEAEKVVKIAVLTFGLCRNRQLTKRP